MSNSKIIQFLRNEGKTASIVKDLNTAKNTLKSLINRGYDGEPVICRYYDDSDEVKTLLGVISYINSTGYITYYVENEEIENSIEELDDEITSKIEALDYSDTAVAQSFVTAVSETDGLISVSRGAVTSNDKTVTISSGSDGGVNLAANIDGDTIVKSGSGVLSVDSSALTQYVGKNAIAISDTDSSNNKTVSLTISDNDLFLTNDSTGLYATLTIEKVSSGLGENVKEAYILTDKNGSQVGEQINIYKDASLDSVKLENQQLVFTYNLASGSQSTVYIDISAFLAESEFSDGLQVSDHIVSVKVDSSSESYLTVSSSGVKLSGITSAINTAATKATTAVAKDSSASHLTLTSTTNSSTGATTYTIGESDIASASALTSEISRATAAEEANASDIDDLEAALKAATITAADGSMTVTAATSGTTIAVKFAASAEGNANDIISVTDSGIVLDNVWDCGTY